LWNIELTQSSCWRHLSSIKKPDNAFCNLLISHFVIFKQIAHPLVNPCCIPGSIWSNILPGMSIILPCMSVILPGMSNILAAMSIILPVWALYYLYEHYTTWYEQYALMRTILVWALSYLAWVLYYLVWAIYYLLWALYYLYEQYSLMLTMFIKICFIINFRILLLPAQHPWRCAKAGTQPRTTSPSSSGSTWAPSSAKAASSFRRPRPGTARCSSQTPLSRRRAAPIKPPSGPRWYRSCTTALSTLCFNLLS